MYTSWKRTSNVTCARNHINLRSIRLVQPIYIYVIERLTSVFYQSGVKFSFFSHQNQFVSTSRRETSTTVLDKTRFGSVQFKKSRLFPRRNKHRTKISTEVGEKILKNEKLTIQSIYNHIVIPVALGFLVKYRRQAACIFSRSKELRWNRCTIIL